MTNAVRFEGEGRVAAVLGGQDEVLRVRHGLLPSEVRNLVVEHDVPPPKHGEELVLSGIQLVQEMNALLFCADKLCAAKTLQLVLLSVEVFTHPLGEGNTQAERIHVRGSEAVFRVEKRRLGLTDGPLPPVVLLVGWDEGCHGCRLCRGGEELQLKMLGNACHIYTSAEDAAHFGRRPFLSLFLFFPRELHEDIFSRAQITLFHGNTAIDKLGTVGKTVNGAGIVAFVVKGGEGRFANSNEAIHMIF